MYICFMLENDTLLRLSI